MVSKQQRSPQERPCHLKFDKLVVANWRLSSMRMVPIPYLLLISFFKRDFNLLHAIGHFTTTARIPRYSALFKNEMKTK